GRPNILPYIPVRVRFIDNRNLPTSNDWHRTVTEGGGNEEHPRAGSPLDGPAGRRQGLPLLALTPSLMPWQVSAWLGEATPMAIDRSMLSEPECGETLIFGESKNENNIDISVCFMCLATLHRRGARGISDYPY